MRYKNPVVRGFYPDPSVCLGTDGKYYMVCSSFQYFPGVPLFESENLVNWKQIGYVLTRPNQVMLEKINSSGGVFAPTIRCYEGRYYMVTTNDTTHQNFYVYTDDIHGEWSDPIYVDQGGIDPSLYFEDGHCYFMSNGSDDEGRSGVVQCEIDIATGQKISPSKAIWQGSGGRFLESPHLYKIESYYYLMAAEGGTEYGHMITYARGRSPWGPFENYPDNPVLTNRNKAPFIIQGIGHGDLICDKNGNWHIISLGFRQLHIWMAYHQLGREVFLTPVTFGEDGWFRAGIDGTTDFTYELTGEFKQERVNRYTFENTSWDVEWSYMRHPHMEHYQLEKNRAVLTGCPITLNDVDSPTFLALRQMDFNGKMSVDLRLSKDAKEGLEAGLTCYACENEHYEVAIVKQSDGLHGILRLNIGGIHHIQNEIVIPAGKLGGVEQGPGPGEMRFDRTVSLEVQFENHNYHFYVIFDANKVYLGSGSSKYLSTEVAGGFTGVMLGLYAVVNQEKAQLVSRAGDESKCREMERTDVKLSCNQAEFTNFECCYTEELQ